MAFERDGSHHLALSLIQSSEYALQIVCISFTVTLVPPEGLHDAVDRDFCPVTPAPERIHDLVARDGRDPRRHGSAPDPRASLEMQSEQHFLDDILGIQPR